MKRVIHGVLFIAAIVAISGGCATTPASVYDPPGIPQVAQYTNVNRMAIVIGVSVADPKAYGGQLKCPGADVDLWKISAETYKRGIKTISLLDSEATWANVRAALAQAADELHAGDWLLLYISGHGMEMPDDDGDEGGGRPDQAACLYDGPVRDDLFGDALRPFRRGVRISPWTDTCHAATGWRAFARAITFGKAYKPVPLIIKAPELDHVEIMQIAMCAADASSWGDAKNGGVGTGNWLTTLKEHPLLGYWPAFNKFFGIMPADQPPVYVENGAVTDRFRYGIPWE